ncbi:MAG: type II toxin-antitoxin system prevent-host-death family antitoxin, partial [Phascolarctobacterium sp.]
YNEPVFITKNGKGDLAVMSIDAYEELVARSELYAKVQRGLDDVQAGRVISADDFVSKLRSSRTYNGGI